VFKGVAKTEETCTLYVDTLGDAAEVSPGEEVSVGGKVIEPEITENVTLGGTKGLGIESGTNEA